MADEDFGDEYGDYYFDDDYLYVEDEYAIADELAEGQVPSPGYSGTNGELAAEFYEWDNYEFWSDLAYGSDSYFDPESKILRKRKTDTSTDGSKRKRTSVTTTVTKDKRRRVTIEQRSELDHGPLVNNVIFRGDQQPLQSPPIVDSMESFALLPDWRERFAKDNAVTWAAPMPEAMKKAAAGGQSEPEAHDADDGEDNASPALANKAPVRSRKHKAKRNAHVAYDEEEEEPLPTSLDPETLRLILRQKLGDAGMDEDAFMAVIQNMMTGGAADDAAEELTKVLLNGEGAQSSALDWLGKQGVNVDAGAEDTVEEEAAARRVDSGAGLLTDPDQPSQRKRKTKADVSSSVESSPTKTRQAAASARGPRKKSKS